jgi:hypothetical protein
MTAAMDELFAFPSGRMGQARCRLLAFSDVACPTDECRFRDKVGSQPTSRKRREWPISKVARRLIEVSSQRYSGPDLLTLSSSQFDPQRIRTMIYVVAAGPVGEYTRTQAVVT